MATPWVAAADELRDRLRGAGLDPGGARRVESLRLDLGGAFLSIEDAWVVPADEVAGQSREFIVLGGANFEMAPDDPVEARQLELFTDSRSVSRRVKEVVLVIGNDAAASALLRGEAEAPDAATSGRARALFDAWRGSGERATLQVEQMLWIDALGDPAGQGYVAAWMLGEDDERFLYTYDPWEFEQITLGQFVETELTEREERRLERHIGRQQRKGRLIGLDVAELGVWDSWVSASPRKDGRPLRGAHGFEAEHYLLSADIAPKTLELSGEATIVVRATTDSSRVVPLQLSSDLVVESVLDAAGRPLDFDQDNARLIVAWPEPPALDSSNSVVVRYSGRIFDEWDGARMLRTTTRWHPGLGFEDPATYDVTLRWPERLLMVGSGQRVDGGRADKQRWERRRLNRPARAFGFELGRFETYTAQAGDIPITLALDPETDEEIRKDVDRLLDTARDSLLYFQEIFGEYPFESLTIATAPRGYSQALPGFVTLARRAAFREVADIPEDDEDAPSRSWTLAHEIAHHWWGHAVGWQSYRDQWISEAAANYSALLFVRNQGEGRRVGPTAGWQRDLVRRTRDGRAVESLGPLVLGQRLNSSLSSSAYVPIVYRKGAVVLDMLARSFGEETFLQVLGALVKAVRGREISTEDFFDLIERITDRDLDAFTDQFIYGTGLPWVFYDYTVEPTDDGQWLVRGVAEQSAPYRWEYTLVDRRRGLLDIERQPVTEMDVDGSVLVVPVQAVLYDPERTTEVEDPETHGNTVLQFHAMLRGRSTRIEFVAPHEPKQLWLDARNEVFGIFYSQHRTPKRTLYYEALVLAGRREWEAATAKLQEAAAAPPYQGRPWGKEAEDEKERRRESTSLDADIQWLLAQMYLDQGRTQSAQAAFDAGEDSWREHQKVRRSRRDRARPAYVVLLEARLNLQKGNPQRAYEILRDNEIRAREWYLCMAIATRELGRTKEFEEARDEAEERGADISLLDVPVTRTR